jgi:hypothetical protein
VAVATGLNESCAKQFSHLAKNKKINKKRVRKESDFMFKVKVIYSSGFKKSLPNKIKLAYH